MAFRLLPRDGEHGWTPYAWLIYVGPYCAFPLLSRPTAWGWAAQTAGLLAFLALYFRGYWMDGARRLPIIIGLATLGVLLTRFNPGAMIFFVFAASFVAGARTGRRAIAWIATIGLVAAATVLMMVRGPWVEAIAVGTAMFSALVGFLNLHTHDQRRRDASLKLAQDEIARLATMAERERIAGDLHDLLGQSLSVIALKSELAAKLVTGEPRRAAAEIQEVQRVSREALAEVRRAVHGFRSASLSDEIVRARAVLHAAQIRAEVDVPLLDAAGAPALPRATEHAIAMILREAVTNVIRHSNATRCTISATRDDDSWRLRIEDDGAGRDVAAGAGVEGMRVRAREIGATLDHHVHRGVSVRLRVPHRGPA